ncbi:GH116 family glycosyl-hydrolase [Paenibacillus sp. BC26]|uniref:GH116 family glycosyl-hydrolase n=1 Tax=Paenibacillus sp. BC26 TaxID=1881032 RepID=UPI0008E2ABF5|nr:GH116 family glycosyl-hydrolase [Paenibacillus sp. BC26]SFT10168.1 Uncharacterized protein, contains GBA2_N and DUF608 domains [Paenibacillus sp. BC26]
MERFSYKDAKLKEIIFPLGGIGSGSIGLAGNGRLVDWEIKNRPNKQSMNGMSHFAVKAESEGKVLDARVLNGKLPPPYMGNKRIKNHSGYGFGPSEATMGGFPHFEDCTFVGEFPIADLHFRDKRFPGDVKLTAYNPFIPLNDQDSSIPGAFFEVEFHNPTDSSITYTACLSVANPHHERPLWNRFERIGSVHGIRMGSDAYSPNRPEFGELTVATDAEEVNCQWYEGREMYWRTFSSPGRFGSSLSEPTSTRDLGQLSAHAELKPGETQRIRFLITWHFPNCHNYWNPETNSGSGASGHAQDSNQPAIWKNYYATLFDDSFASALYAFEHWERLYRDTLLFKRSLYASDLPKEALEAVAANLSTLKSPTVLRLEDGSLYGFEGCIDTEGCCEGSCTHVWNYAYAAPFLFPKLERSMRNLDYKYNMRADGRMSFRIQLPLGRANDLYACADGQFGGIIKVYREWKISGDSDWLRSLWPSVQQSLEYAWAETNEHRWDADRDGVLEGRQHNTLDVELFGPNAWLNGFYLAALKAGAEMAAYLGYPEKAEDYRALYERGKSWTDQHLFNGKHYIQKIDLSDKSLLETCDDEALEYYWNDRWNEINYQILDGCSIDQVVAQWHANLCGLGEIFDPTQTRQALQSIYEHNFKQMSDFTNLWRLYSLDDESGLIICSWPEGSRKPAIPITYNSETMNGFEYQAAIHMIQEGMVEEGMSVVRAVRERYDGEKRNPWNEMECGSHYARSMASYALLLTFSGFDYDMVNGHVGFNPIDRRESYETFWSLEAGWGIFKLETGKAELHVQYGELSLLSFGLPFLSEHDIAEIRVDGYKVDWKWEKGNIVFSQQRTISQGNRLEIELRNG